MTFLPSAPGNGGSPNDGQGKRAIIRMLCHPDGSPGHGGGQEEKIKFKVRNVYTTSPCCFFFFADTTQPVAAGRLPKMRSCKAEGRGAEAGARRALQDTAVPCPIRDRGHPSKM